MTSYEVVRYTPRFKDRVAELQTHLWSPNPDVNLAYLEWKYEHNPYLPTPLIHLAVCGDAVVGMRGIYGARWQVDTPPRALSIPCAGDLVIHPRHRNRGLGAKIMEAATADLATAGYDYVFNLSATIATQISSLASGWRSLGPLEVATHRPAQPILVSRAIATARRLRLPLSAMRRAWAAARPRLALSTGGAPDAFSALDAAARRRRGARPVVLGSGPRPEAMAEIVDRVGQDGRIRHARDAEYFAWRFQNPLSTYRFIFWGNARLDGYLVLRAAAHDGDVVTIIDWEAVDTTARSGLLRTAVDWGRFETLRIWSATLLPESRMLLRRAGFAVDDPPQSIGHAYRARIRRPMLLVSAIGGARADPSDWAVAGRPLLDLASWDVRGLYSDSF